MREPAFERIADEIVLVGARKGLDQQVAGLRNQRAPLLDVEPFAHLIGQCVPCLRIGEHVAHALGEIGRERKLAAFVGRNFRIVVLRARDIDLVLDERLVAQDLAGKHEGVAGRHGLDEIFLDLAEAACRRARSGRNSRGAFARERTRRTFSMSASTMVPTFMR